MVKMINCMTGTEMWVAEERVDEYKAAGHKPAVDVKEESAKETKPAPKKRTTKK